MIKLSSEALSSALYHLDPMYTMCSMNECFDEYDEISEVILNRLDFSKKISNEENKEIIQEAFKYFFEKELAEDDFEELVSLLDF